MGKKLSEMSLEELWQLFPIRLSPHNERWKADYSEMEAFLFRSLEGLSVRRISHIGSTAVPSIQAKPIVDILVEFSDGADLKQAADVLVSAGFLVMSAEETRISLNYGYTEQGFAEKVFHLHLRCSGDNDELYFRDYLNAHPDAATEYEELKLSLWKRFEHDRDGYTEAKTGLVLRLTSLARAEFPGRYS